MRVLEDVQATDWFGRLLLLLTVPMLAIAADAPFGWGWLSSVGGVVAGALIGLGAAHYYSRLASRELHTVADDVRQELLNMHLVNRYTIELLDEANRVNARRDADGNLVIPVEKQLAAFWAIRAREAGQEESGA